MAAADACPVTAEDVAFYQREGYLVLREFASAADVARLGGGGAGVGAGVARPKSGPAFAWLTRSSVACAAAYASSSSASLTLKNLT